MRPGAWHIPAWSAGPGPLLLDGTLVPLVRLLYASDAVGILPYSTLVGIMTHAQQRNPTRGITGMLCYGSGQFLQVLEGDREPVNRLYHAIARDTRHERCELLSVSEVDRRDFPEWSMKVVNWEDGDAARRRALLEGETGSAVFNPRALSADQAISFLRHLAELERELASE